MIPWTKTKNPMLEALTWNHYFGALAFGLAAYYIGIVLYYYPTELRSLVSGKARPFNSIPQPEKIQTPSPAESQVLDPFEELEATVAELQGILGKAGNMTDKANLLRQVAQLLSNHPGLREPAYRVAIDNFFLDHVAKHFPFSISAFELEDLWKD